MPRRIRYKRITLRYRLRFAYLLWRRGEKHIAKTQLTHLYDKIRQDPEAATYLLDDSVFLFDRMDMRDEADHLIQIALTFIDDTQSITERYERMAPVLYALLYSRRHQTEYAALRERFKRTIPDGFCAHHAEEFWEISLFEAWYTTGDFEMCEVMCEISGWRAWGTFGMLRWMCLYGQRSRAQKHLAIMHHLSQTSEWRVVDQFGLVVQAYLAGMIDEAAILYQRYLPDINHESLTDVYFRDDWDDIQRVLRDRINSKLTQPPS